MPKKRHHATSYPVRGVPTPTPETAAYDPEGEAVSEPERVFMKNLPRRRGIKEGHGESPYQRRKDVLDLQYQYYARSDDTYTILRSLDTTLTAMLTSIQAIERALLQLIQTDKEEKTS